MKKYLFVVSNLVWGICAFVPVVNAETVKVEGMTVDVFLSGNPSDPTVMYFPGCNGKDTFGAKYQDFHVQKMAKAWDGKVNIVRLQLVNDITHVINGEQGDLGNHTNQQLSQLRLLALDPFLRG